MTSWSGYSPRNASILRFKSSFLCALLTLAYIKHLLASFSPSSSRCKTSFVEYRRLPPCILKHFTCPFTCHLRNVWAHIPYFSLSFLAEAYDMVSKGGLAENVTRLSQQLPEEGHFLFHLGAFLSWEVNIVGQCLRRSERE